jgi:hypothetical protein
MDDSEPLIFGVMIAQKAQIIGFAKESDPAQRPLSCILSRVAVPAVAGAPPDVVVPVVKIL